ncbi:MAG: efflux RND transporter periplasmic adaptor subunit [Rubrivivax sp.]|nr:efflux RND transporter periplasmic adaptor subunit [Rubrivivax sp.]
MRRSIKVTAFAVLLLAAAGTAWWWQQRTPAPVPDKYRTALVDRGPITQVVMATGTLQPVTTVNVGTQVSGTVLERLADFNDRVKRGQVLLRLDPANLQARLRQAQAQLASAEASLALARATLERNQRLVAQNFISALVLDQSQREVAVARAGVELARAQLDAAQTDLDNSVIRSPIDGVVIKRNVDVGQTVAASFQTPDLYLLARDLREMQIHTNVSEADVGQVRPGQEVRFSVDAYPDGEFEGRVQQFRLNSTNTAGVVTYTIVVDVANADERLKPGMTAQTRIVLQSKRDVLRLPTAALRFQPDDDERKAIAAAASASGAASGAASPATRAATAAASAASDDDGVLSSTRGGQRVYRVWTVGPGQVPQPQEVTAGISNTRFTELASVVSGSVKAGDALITRRADSTPGR